MDIASILRTGFPDPVIPGIPLIVDDPDALPGEITDRSAEVICDTNTRGIAETVLAPIFGPRASYREVLGPEPAVLDTELVGRTLMEIDREEDPVLVGVGSGTIADLTRLIASRCDLPYLLVPTAASVDGFTSSVAPVAVEGMKRTFPAKPPDAILVRDDVLAAAPERLTRSGYGDLRGKITAILDWRFAAAIKGDTFRKDVTDTVLGALETVDRVFDRDGEWSQAAVRALFDGLAVSGLAINAVGSSRPASGSEHHISHYLEHLYLAGRAPKYFHGETVALGTRFILLLYGYLRDRGEFIVPVPILPPLTNRNPGPDVGLMIEHYGIPILAETLTKARHVRERYTILGYLHDRKLLRTAVESVLAGLPRT